MPTAALQFYQYYYAGGIGQAYLGVPLVEIEIINGGDNTGVTTWTWTLLSVPIGSAHYPGVQQTGGTSFFLFMPDVPGSFVFTLTVTDGVTTSSDTKSFLAADTRGYIYPSHLDNDATLNYGSPPNAQGWMPGLNAILKDVHDNAFRTFVFQPAGTAGGNVYTDEALLASAVLTASLEGPTLVVFDLTFVGFIYTFATPGNLDFGPNCTWTTIDVTGAGGIALYFANETTLTYAPNLAGSVGVFVDQIAPVVTWFGLSDVVGSLCEVRDYAVIIASSAPFILTAGGGAMHVNLRDFAQIYGPTGTYVLSGGNYYIAAFDTTILGPNCISGSGIFVEATGGGVSIDSGLYGVSGISIYIQGLYVDSSGLALANLPANQSPSGALLSTGGALYIQNANTWTAIGGIGGNSTVFVFQPKGTPGGNVYTDEGLLSAAVLAISGPVTIFFDLSQVGAYEYYFQTIGNLNLGQNTTWASPSDDFNVGTIQFAYGTTLSFPPVEVHGNLNIAVAQPDTVCTLTTACTTSFHDTSVLYSAEGYFVDNNGSDWTVRLKDNSNLGTGAALFANSVTVWVFDAALLYTTAEGSGNTHTIVGSPTAYVDTDYYANMFINGLFVDYSGTATSVIPASNIINSTAYILQAGTLYYSNGASWIAVGGGVTSSFVFQPGGTAAGNIYTDETLLAAATQMLNGAPYTIFFDLSQYGSPSYYFATSGVWNIAPNSTWANDGQTYSLFFVNNTTIPSPPVAIRGGISVLVAQGTTVCTMSADAITSLYDSVIVSSETQPFVDAGSFEWKLTLNDASVLGQYSENPTAGNVKCYLNDSSGVQAPGDTSGYLIIINNSSGTYVDPIFYNYLYITGLFVDYSGTGSTSIPASNVWTDFGGSPAFLLEPGALYFSNGGPEWVSIVGGTGGTSPTGSATYSQAGFTASIYLIDTLGNEFPIPLGMSFSINVRTLITSVDTSADPAVFVDELLIQGSEGYGSSNTIFNPGATLNGATQNILSVDNGTGWTVHYSLGGDGPTVLHITVDPGGNAGSGLNAITTVTWVQNVNSAQP
jgi:hypothetical protein